MTKFLDGPAEGVVLALKRAPLLLRVTRSPAGEWDALDQLNDTPNADETLVAYHLVSGPCMVHVNMGRRGCGWYQLGEYRVVATQPTDAEMRTTVAWRSTARTLAAGLGKTVAEDGSIMEQRPA